MNIDRNERANWQNWCVTFALALGFVTVALLALVVWADPFQLFRRDNLYIVDRKFQQLVNAGFVRTAEADNIILGSSMSANFNPSLVSHFFGGTTLVVSMYGGGTEEDWRHVLTYTLTKRTGLRRLFFEFPLAVACGASMQKAGPFTGNIYGDPPFAALLRLLSSNSIMLALIKLQSALDGEARFPFSRDIRLLYRWHETYEHLFRRPDRIAALYSGKDAIFQPRPTPEIIEMVAARLASCYYENVLSMTKLNPAVELYFFSVPTFQWELWRLQWQEPYIPPIDKTAYVDIIARAQEHLADLLNGTPNARFFEFNAAVEITNDCNRYLDMHHFDATTNDAMTRWMYEGQYQSTPRTSYSLSAAMVRNVRDRVPCPPSAAHDNKD